MSRVSTCRDVRHNVPVTQGFYAFIAVPSISPNFRSPLHTIQHEFVKAHHRYIWNDRHTYSTCTTPSNFCCYSYDRLSLSATTANFRPTTSNGCLTFTVSAQKQTTPHQRRLLCIAPATGTTETFRPSKFRNIVKASIFAAKPLIKLLERSRIINAGQRCLGSSITTIYYILWPVE